MGLKVTSYHYIIIQHVLRSKIHPKSSEISIPSCPNLPPSSFQVKSQLCRPFLAELCSVQSELTTAPDTGGGLTSIVESAV